LKGIGVGIGKGIEKGIGKELNQFPLLTERKVMAGD